MKKSIAFLIALVLILGAALPAGAFAQSAPFTPDGSVLFEKDGVKVTTAGLDIDPTSADEEPIIWLDVENTGGRDAYLGVTNGSVNGFMTSALLIQYSGAEEEGFYNADYSFDLTVPAGECVRCALGYYDPGIKLEAFRDIEFCFTLAEDEYSWPDYCSEPVVVATGEEAEDVDIASLGTVVLDNDKLTVVLGEQDYDDGMGPLVYVYAENKSDHFLGLSADEASADGVDCGYILYGTVLAPGKKSASFMCFDGDAQAMKGFEDFSVAFSLYEGASEDELYMREGTALEPVSLRYPPQPWGEYENAGLRLEIQPKYNALVTVDTPADDEDGVLFTVSETASLEAGGYEGAGFLFSIARLDTEKLHKMLCHDMSGAEVFAKDLDGNYYVKYHPTDVRYARATVEEMYRDEEQWSMLCSWVDNAVDSFREKNGLEYAAFGNSEVEMLVARAAWEEGAKPTLSTTEFGPADASAVDGTPYAEFVMQGWFWEAGPEETPDGQYVVLAFPGEDLRLDFFFAPGAYVRVVSGGDERLYQAMWYDDDLSFAELMQGWYYAAAEKAGVKPADDTLSAFSGEWAEKVAKRGRLTVTPTLAPNKARIAAVWPESAAVQDTWEMTAALDGDGKLVYEKGLFTSTEYGEGGEGWEIDSDWSISGQLSLNENGELLWQDSRLENPDSIFIRVK